MQERAYVWESSELKGSDFTVTYACVRLGADGSCALVTGELTDHAMLESYASLEVRTGLYSERGEALWLVLTSRYVYDEHVDDYGLHEASRSPTQTIDEAVRLEREGEGVRLGEEVLRAAELPPCVVVALRS